MAIEIGTCRCGKSYGYSTSTMKPITQCWDCKKAQIEHERSEFRERHRKAVQEIRDHIAMQFEGKC